MVIVIRPIRKDEIPAAKRVILTVAYGIFGWDGSLEDSIQYFESSNEFTDMDNMQTYYFDNGGLFLAVLDDERLIGSGAIAKLNQNTGELKRIWLLEAYHGRGIGYQLITALFDFARIQGYQRIRLQTSPKQSRAIAFYKRLGFLEIPCYNDDKGEISMGIALGETK